MRKSIALGLSLSIFLSAPGFLPYVAVAATLGEGANPQIKIVPQVAPGLTTPNIQTPQIPGTAEIPGIALPGAIVGPEIQNAAATTPSAEQPTVIGGVEKLAAAVAPDAKPQAGSPDAALTNAYTGAKADHPEYDPGDPNAVLGAANKDENCSAAASGCPFAKLFGKSSKRENGNGGSSTPAPARPKPADVGILHKAAMYAMAYTWWVWDRVIQSKWDKMPPMIAAVYLYFNEQYLRLHVWDANAQPSTANKAYGAATEDQKKFRTADGSYMDLKDPGMAAADTRFNHLREPAGPANPNWDKMEPNPFVVSQELQQRAHDAQGNPIIKEIPANSWFTQIQSQLHDWFNHEQEPLTNNPVKFTVPVGHPLKPEGGEVIMNRTKTDPSVPTSYQGPAIHRNGETSPWDRSDLYGSSAETQAAVRTHKDGHLVLGEDGWLPDDPQKPGVPKTGFNNNVSPTLTMNNVVMAKEHNLVADAINAEYRAKGVQLSDEELFQKARLRMTGFNARNHTVPWTQWLFAGSKTGQEIMWADWYGFLGKKFKLAYMRFTDRHPKLAKITDKFVRLELLFGIPGTATTHYGKNYNFVEEFVDVYRMHQLIRDTYAINHLEANPDGTIEVRIIDNMKLRDIVGPKTQDAMRKHSLEDWALTMGKQNVGELTINNVPDDLRNLTAQDGAKDGHKVDLGAIDILRTRERLEASTYVKFTIRLGEKPPRTFEELTGGDKAKADALRAVYKSINDVDFQIGILAERKPQGFALGNRQFKVFVLSAPGRLKNDRFLSSEYNAKTYDQSGIDYMETNNWSNLVVRAAPGLKALDIEAMANPYMTYPEAGWLPKALSADSETAGKALDKSFQNAWITNSLTALAMLMTGAMFPVAAGFLPAIFLAAAGLDKLEDSRALINGARTIAGAKAAAEAADRGALLARLGAGAGALIGAFVAWSLFATMPWIAAGLGLATLVTSRGMLKKASAAAAAVRLQATELKTRLRVNAEHIDPASIPGDNAISKRYWFLLGDKNTPVATFSASYKALRRSGISAISAFATAGLAHLVFSPKTQKNMTAAEKAKYAPGRFDIYLPNIIDANNYSSSRVYMTREDAAKVGGKPGDINMAEFDRIFRDYGALRGYVTAYDLERMIGDNQWRDKVEGRGNWFNRLAGKLASKSRAKELIQLFADRVVWEDGLPGGRVPAISRERMLQFYQGAAQIELNREEGK